MIESAQELQKCSIQILHVENVRTTLRRRANRKNGAAEAKIYQLRDAQHLKGGLSRRACQCVVNRGFTLHDPIRINQFAIR